MNIFIITFVALCISLSKAQYSPNYNGNNYGVPASPAVSQNVFSSFEELNRRMNMLLQSNRNDYSPLQRFPSPAAPAYQPQYPTSVQSQNGGQFPDYSRPPTTNQPIYSIPLINPAQQQLGRVAAANSGQYPDPSRPPSPPIDYSIPLQPQAGSPPPSLSGSFSVQHGSYQARPQPQFSVPAAPQYQPSSPPSYPPANVPQYQPQPAYNQPSSYSSPPAYSPQPSTNPQPTYSNAPVLQSFTNTGPQSQGDYKFGYKTTDGGIFREETRNADGSVSGSYGFIDANGKQRTVKYTAGKDGFRAEGDDIPQPVAGAPSSPQPAPQQYNSQPVPRYASPQSSYNGSPAYNNYPQG